MDTQTKTEFGRVSLEQEAHGAIGRLRAALIDLYDSIGADPANPQDVARTYKLNKTLTWKFAKLIENDNGLTSAAHVPGVQSIEKFLSATSSNGAAPEAVSRVRAAAIDFENMVQVHVGDRATLDLILDGMHIKREDALELSRKRAFHGNSGIYGVQAKTNLLCCALAPNPDNPDQLDMTMVRAYVGLRRLRANIRIRQWSKAGQSIGSETWQPLESGSSDGFMPDFGAASVPQITRVDISGEGVDGADYILEPGPIGNFGALDCCFGEKLHAGASLYQTDGDETGEFGLTVTVPTERLLFDLIVHESIRFALDAKTLVYAHLFGQEHNESNLDDAALLPINKSATLMAGSPPAVATPAMPNYSRLFRHVCKEMNWKPAEFRGSRLELAYPPLGSTTIRRFELPKR